jgi:mitochondrial fission protein ELM1
MDRLLPSSAADGDYSPAPAAPAASGGREARPRPPRVWAMLCYRYGDNEQILALAEALGWPFEVKRLAYRPFGRWIDILRLPTLAGILKRESDAFGPPWPDLVISSSVRNEPVCWWVQKHADRPVRYVHVGRPWAFLKNFDLVVTQPQYRLARRPNVLEIPLCLHRITEQKLREAGRRWAPRLAHLQRPYIAVVVGGYGGAYAFDPEKAERLARQASDLAIRQGASLLVSTSSRTGNDSAEALRRAVTAPAYVHLWQAGAKDNPYLAFLALAEAIIVTSDSVSMLSEACATGKPVYMFDLGQRAGDNFSARNISETLRRFRQRCHIDVFKAFLYRQLVHVPPRRMTRDVELVHRFLLDTKRAVWLGQPFPATAPPPIDDLGIAAARVRALFPPSRGARSAPATTPGTGWEEDEKLAEE